jgi:hypothetical protein
MGKRNEDERQGGTYLLIPNELQTPQTLSTKIPHRFFYFPNMIVPLLLQLPSIVSYLIKAPIKFLLCHFSLNMQNKAILRIT